MLLLLLTGVLKKIQQRLQALQHLGILIFQQSSLKRLTHPNYTHPPKATPQRRLCILLSQRLCSHPSHLPQALSCARGAHQGKAAGQAHKRCSGHPGASHLKGREKARTFSTTHCKCNARGERVIQAKSYSEGRDPPGPISH